MSNNEMIFRELGNLIALPNLAIAGGFAQEHKRPALAVNFIIDFGVLAS
jgi:hypothetical protein